MTFGEVTMIQGIICALIGIAMILIGFLRDHPYTIKMGWIVYAAGATTAVIGKWVLT